ncbi:hypothetical protein MNAN1_001806 [Malassezia nana]|uniref:Histidine kinase n=1 Tax=Malassezia nana TaxID=180528 RepID=A0AAF0EHW1_9BASI|nr:hypothetical protein MNAN1_001806 [Malassezia nana]
MSSHILDMPYVSIKLLAPQPRLHDDKPGPFANKRGLFPFTVISEWTSQFNQRLVKDETGCSQTLAAHSLLLPRGELMIIPDVDEDWRFKGSPYRNGFKFFIATPLYGSQGEMIGAFCVGDIKARPPLSACQQRLFMDLTTMITNSIDLSVSTAQLGCRDRLKLCVENFLLHFLSESENQDKTEGTDPTSNNSGTEPASFSETAINHASSKNYMHIFNFAAQALHRSMDVSGVVIFDLSSFVMAKKPGNHGMVNEQVIHSRMSRQNHSGWDLLPDGFPEEADVTDVPALSQLGASEASEQIPDRSKPMHMDHVYALCQFLSSVRLGQHFQDNVPEAIAKLLPQGIVDTLLVPIMDADSQPFALLCCYSLYDHYAFILDQMVHTAIQHTRAIGYMIMDVIARQSVVLADRSKSSFISNMSHELRTPLHGILASTELLSDTSMNDMQRSYTHTIESCGRGLLELVNHVLDYTKLSSGVNNTGLQQQKHVSYSNVDLVQLLQEVCDSSLVGHLGQRRTDRTGSSIGSMYDPGQADSKRAAKSSNIELVIDIEKRQEGWFAFCDSGYILVSLRYTPLDEHKVRAIFRVKDSGCGISRTFLDQHLFQPFSQEDPLKGGTGLGLSIVNELVRNMDNGVVHVESVPDQGTDIVVSCDLAMSALPETGYIPRLYVAQSYTVHIFKSAQDTKGTALVRSTLRQYLQIWWGFQVAVYEDPTDMRFLEASGRDILLMNTQVAPLRALLDSVRKDRKRLPPVVVLANLYSESDHLLLSQEYKRAGGRIYLLQKPVGPARLEEAFTSSTASIDTASEPPSQSQESEAPNLLDMGKRDQGVTFSSPPLERDLHAAVKVDVADETLSHAEREREKACVSPPLIAAPDSPVSKKLASTMFELDKTLRDEAPPATTTSISMLNTPRATSSAHILFVDDNQVNRQVLRAYLKKLHISCSEARDGSEAILQFSSRPPGFFDLIIMDYSMPNVDGLTATLAIRQLERQRSAVEGSSESRQPKSTIYILSGSSSNEILRQVYAAGADGYLSKPLSFKVFVSLLKSIGLQ